MHSKFKGSHYLVFDSSTTISCLFCWSGINNAQNRSNLARRKRYDDELRNYKLRFAQVDKNCKTTSYKTILIEKATVCLYRQQSNRVYGL